MYILWKDISEIYYWHVCIYQPLLTGRMWLKVNFKRSLIGLKSEFSLSFTGCLTKAQTPSLLSYLLIAGFIIFPRVLMLYEMQSPLSRIWTRLAVSISDDDNHYTTDTSLLSVRNVFGLKLLRKKNIGSSSLTDVCLTPRSCENVTFIGLESHVIRWP